MELITVKARHTVKPAKPTWNGTVPLSELDQIGVITHTSLVYIYTKPTQDEAPNYPSYDEIHGTLMASLSQALVPFYPLAGRLHWLAGERLELECNAMGVELIEAESNERISHVFMADDHDFIMPASLKALECLEPSVDYMNKQIEEIPLLVVQVTRFACGGIALGTAMSHTVTDGQGAFHFLRVWASLARGGEQPKVEQDSPYLDRRALQAQNNNEDDDETLVDEQVDYFSRLPKLVGKGDGKERMKETMAKTLVLTKSQVDWLKKVANEEMEVNDHKDGRRYSRFEVVAAHVWRCASKARKHKSEQTTALCFCVDARSRMNPPLPPRYFGNAIVDMVATSQAGELITRPLSHACQRIREVTKTVTGDYIWSIIKFIKAQKSLAKYQDRAALGCTEGVLYGDPNLGVSSWLNLPVRGLDFGWGKEKYMELATPDFDGDVTLLPGHNNDGSVVVYIGLQVEHMEEFKKYFYEDIKP